MKERAAVFAQMPNCTFRGVYVHTDGGYDDEGSVGRILDLHYRDWVDAAALAALDHQILRLGMRPRIGDEVHGSRAQGAGNVPVRCVPAGGANAGLHAANEQAARQQPGVDYVYLYTGGRWYVSECGGEWRVLETQILLGQAISKVGEIEAKMRRMQDIFRR